MALAKEVEEIRDFLWQEADRLYWSSLSLPEKSRYYTIWTETASIGGRLAALMDPREVRVYIKDTLLKPYTRERIADPEPVLRLLKLPASTAYRGSYIKPHGRQLIDGRQIAWSRATEWKSTLMALHERAFEANGTPYGAVLFEAMTRHADPPARRVVDDAAAKLGLEALVWVD